MIPILNGKRKKAKRTRSAVVVLAKMAVRSIEM